MTAPANAQPHAEKILAILKQSNVRPGECRLLKAIEKDFVEGGGALSDCVGGLEFGVEKGWIRLSGAEIFLTEQGAAQSK